MGGDAGTPTEAEALAAYQAAGNPEGIQACLKLLAEAGRTKRVAPQLVEGALVYLERHAPPGGVWRPRFVCVWGGGGRSIATP